MRLLQLRVRLLQLRVCLLQLRVRLLQRRMSVQLLLELLLQRLALARLGGERKLRLLQAQARAGKRLFGLCERALGLVQPCGHALAALFVHRIRSL